MKLVRLVLASVVLLGSFSSSVKADDFGQLGLAYLYGYGGFNQGAISSYNTSLPYFSLRPPVYYGKRYTRPYGVSPYAAWPQLNANPTYAPTPAAARAKVIQNPYASGAAAPISSAGGIVVIDAPKPKVIVNPYAQPGNVQYTAKESTTDRE